MTKNNKDDFFNGINITPFTDVVLVLLIIFMVAAPQFQKDSMNIKLPKTTVKNQAYIDNENAYEITILNSKEIFFNGSTMEITMFNDYLNEKIEKPHELTFAVAADAASSYQQVMNVLDIMRKKNIEKIILRTEL